MSQIAAPATASQQPSAAPIVSAERQTCVIDVEGMMCAGCVSTVEKKLAQCEGVISATVNLVTEVAAVEYDQTTAPTEIAQALSAAGYPSQPRQTDQQQGLNAEADWLARKESEQKDQGIKLAIALTLLIFSILGHLQHLNISDGVLRDLIDFPVISTLWFHGSLATLTLLFPARKILIEGFQGMRRGAPNMNTLVSLGALSAYITSIAALVFPRLGWECFFDEPVMLLSFILLGRTLEQRARFRAAGSLRSLIALQPTLARLVFSPDSADKKNTPQNSDAPQNSEKDHSTPSSEVQIPASQVQIGEWLRVLPGEKVPADGIITTGQTTVDESLVTGESLPVIKQTGDDIIAGTLNQSGVITLKVSRTGAETTLGQMIQLVETAQTRKAPIQGLSDVLSGYFTYGVLTCAALTFCFWYFVGVPIWPEVTQIATGHVHHAAAMPAMQMGAQPVVTELVVTESMRLLLSLKLAIAVVVVACPCALGLATPTAILVGSGLGAEKGLLIRGGDILEAAQGLDTLVFDKTGTLTTGSPKVSDTISVDPNISGKKLLQLAATVEEGTRHPLAIAIQQSAQQQSLPLLNATNFYTQAGLGVSATLIDKQQTIHLGNLAWMQQNDCNVTPAITQQAAELATEGKTVVFVSVNQQLVGLLGVADTLRPEAQETLRQLQSSGIEVQILSGDRPEAASMIAQQLGLSANQVQADVSPEGKVSAIAHLQQLGHKVGLVGDGINDAPALAQSDVGIALNSGTEIAMETADIVLMGDSLSDVLNALRLSRTTFNKIRQNLTWAFAYNLICIPLAAGFFLPAYGISLNPGFAGGLMALSSVTVVVNSLLLRLQQN